MENISRQIFNKIACAKDIMKAVQKIEPLQEFSDVKLEELDEIYHDFITSTCHLISDLVNKDITPQKANMEFATILSKENYARHIDFVVESCQNYLESVGVSMKKINKKIKNPSPSCNKYVKRKSGHLLYHEDDICKSITEADMFKIKEILCKYPYSKKDARGNIVIDELDGNVTIINMMICMSCGNDYVIDTKKTELQCSCGNVNSLLGIHFDDNYYHDEYKPRIVTFNPNKHYHKWMKYILALEPDEDIGDPDDPDNHCGEKLIRDINELITRDKKILRTITVVDVRHMLARLGKSNLYKNCALIMKKLTGIGPPEYDIQTMIMLEMTFVEVVEIINKLHKEDTSNKTYYPNYIARLIDIKIPESDVEKRRALYYIYVQSEETVMANDEDWKLICNISGKIEYRPLDRRIGEKYEPS